MSKKLPADQWYSGDWFRAVDVRKCSFAVRGLWREMLDIMVNEQEKGLMRGTRAELCRVIGCTSAELDSFLSANKAHEFADVTIRNGKVTIINRRMHRAFLASEQSKLRVRRHRDRAKRDCNADVTPLSSSSSSNNNSVCNTSVTSKKKLFPLPGKTCSFVAKGHICGMPAVYKKPGTEYDHYLCMDHVPPKVKEQFE